MIYFPDLIKFLLTAKLQRFKTLGRKVNSDQDSFASLASYPVEALAKTDFVTFAVNFSGELENID